MPIIEDEEFVLGPRSIAKREARENAILAAAQAAYENFRAGHNTTELGAIKPKKPWGELPDSSRQPIINDTRAAIDAYLSAINI